MRGSRARHGLCAVAASLLGSFRDRLFSFKLPARSSRIIFHAGFGSGVRPTRQPPW
jgi:hypothetical protein